MRCSPRANPWSSCCITGRALAVPELVEQSGALVHAFFPGIEGGHALADVLFGDYNPGGKQPVTWPRSVGQLPIHHYDPPNGRPNIPERGDYKAHWLDESDEPLFAFGFGLRYTQLRRSPRSSCRARIGRDGYAHGARARSPTRRQRDGDEVPQLYIRPRVASAVTGKRLHRLPARASRGRRIRGRRVQAARAASSRCSIRRIAGRSSRRLRSDARHERAGRTHGHVRARELTRAALRTPRL